MTRAPWRLAALGPIALLATLPRNALAASLVINNLDGAGEGFNDPTPASPVGGNSGATVGAQRLIAFQTAANIWGSLLTSSITIRVDAKFDPLTCSVDTAVLGSAATIGTWKDFSGAPLAGHYYVSALANSLANQDLDNTKSELRATFNSSLGSAGCLPGAGWYYGLDGNEGNLTDLVAAVMHELAHGLGFNTFVNLNNGANTLGGPDAFESRMLDLKTGKHWDVMTDAERLTSSTNTRRVVWDGPLVTSATPQTLVAGTPLLTVSSPASIQGEYLIGTATFGPSLAQHPASGQLRLVQDAGGASTTDACESVVNNVSGTIVLVDLGGTCSITSKVKNAQNAGAAAVLIADNVAGSPPANLVASDSTITIPSARITMADGATFKAALSGNTVVVNLAVDNTRFLGTDAQHRALLYTPSPAEPGSSLIHWDDSATPNLLLEPFIFPDVTHTGDLAVPALRDLGWNSTVVSPVPDLPEAWSTALLVMLALGGASLARRRNLA
jgi:hypothetical protein